MITVTDSHSAMSLQIRDSTGLGPVTVAICGPKGGDRAWVRLDRTALVGFAREILAAYGSSGEEQ